MEEMPCGGAAPWALCAVQWCGGDLAAGLTVPARWSAVAVHRHRSKAGGIIALKRTIAVIDIQQGERECQGILIASLSSPVFPMSVLPGSLCAGGPTVFPPCALPLPIC